MRLLAAIICAGVAAGLFAGCGGSEGASAGASVRVYVAAPLCDGAQRGLAQAGATAGDLRVSLACLAPTNSKRPGRPLDLATVGANARRATQDSTAIAFVEPPGPANRFAKPIVQESGIAWVTASSGATAMATVLRAVTDVGTTSGSLRDEVRKTLESG